MRIVCTALGSDGAGQGKAVHNAEHSTISHIRPHTYPQCIHNHPTHRDQVLRRFIHTMHSPYYCY